MKTSQNPDIHEYKSVDDGLVADMDYVEVIRRFLSIPTTPDTTKEDLQEELITQLAMDPMITTHPSTRT